MSGHCKVAIFTAHKGDPLSDVISAHERSCYSHAAILVDEARLTIFEQYEPCARFRILGRNELAGIRFFEIAGWTDEQDAGLRALLKKRATAKVPYWIEGLFLFGPEFRELFGICRWLRRLPVSLLRRMKCGFAPVEGTDADWARHAFCSMEVFEDVRLQGCQVLNAHCWEVSPALLSMSPLLIPAKGFGA